VKVLPEAQIPLKTLQAAQADFESFKRLEIYLFQVLPGDIMSFLLPAPVTAEKEPHLANNIAVLNMETTSTLWEIAPFCTFEAYSSSDQWISMANGTTTIEKNTNVSVDVVVYGQQEFCQKVGRLLGDKKIFLQKPDYWEPNSRYENPHILDLAAIVPEVQVDLRQSRSSILEWNVGSQNELAKDLAIPQSLPQKISMAFDNTTRAQSLKRIAADIRIRTPLLS
jgi:hypothetical protein